MAVEPGDGAWKCVDVGTDAYLGGAGSAAASGTFVNSMAASGWGLLKVNTALKSAAAAEQQAFAAGCVEAKLTHRQVRH
eukprot:SAG31_NODE_3113_length_4660_cov_2.867354_4_plen_79_part_00